MEEKACPRGNIKIKGRCKPRYRAEIISAFGAYRDVHNADYFRSISMAERWADSQISNAESWRVIDGKTGNEVSSLE